MSTAVKVTFGKFPKVANGDNCGGKSVTVDGVSVGEITREIDWTRNAGTSERYTSKVTGYTVRLWVLDEEPTFATLADAHAFARSALEMKTALGR